jgi:hypothetical protein
MENSNTRHQTPRILHIGCITALALACTVAVPQAAQAQSVVTPPPVPANIQVPAGNEAFLLGRAVGTQNYECQPAASVGQVAWTLFTPEATLFGDQREPVIFHFFSPNPFEFSPTPFANGVVRATWQSSQDASTIWGKVTGSATVDPTAIAWVLVQATGVEKGPTGGDTLAVTTFVQRLNTFGGLAPATGCNHPTDVGSKAFVPYRADYFFFRPITVN